MGAPPVRTTWILVEPLPKGRGSKLTSLSSEPDGVSGNSNSQRAAWCLPISPVKSLSRQLDHNARTVEVHQSVRMVPIPQRLDILSRGLSRSHLKLAMADPELKDLRSSKRCAIQRRAGASRRVVASHERQHSSYSGRSRSRQLAGALRSLLSRTPKCRARLTLGRSGGHALGAWNLQIIADFAGQKIVYFAMPRNRGRSPRLSVHIHGVVAALPK